MKKTTGSKPEKRFDPLFLIEEDDIFSDLTEKSGSSLFLGKYTEKVVLDILEKNGFFKKVKKKGLWPLDYELDSSAFPPLQRLLIFYRTKKPENVVMELRIREGAYRFKNGLSPIISNAKFSFLILDWLMIQDPRHRFSRENPPLPGQTYPGLNLGRKTIDIFADIGRLDHEKGLLAFPAFFHVSLIFFPRCRFVNPHKTGEVLSIWNKFGKVGFSRLAWIAHLECLKKDEKTVYKWESEEMVYPMCKELKKYFHSKSYKKKVREAMHKNAFSIDWELFEKKFEAEMSSMEKEDRSSRPY